MQNMGVQHKGGMYNMKRVIALLLTLVMLLGLVPTALAAEAAAPGLFADEAHHQDERADHQRRGGERLCGGNHPAHRASAR